jgi:diacylglycerol kinase family enzyme
LWAAVRTIATWRNLSATLIVQDASSTIELTHLGVAKSPWLAGGLHYDTPIEPGRFAVNLCEGMGRLRAIRTLAALARGRFVGLPGTRSWSASRASVALAEPCDLELDGEIFRASRVTFELLGERIRLCA